MSLVWLESHLITRIGETSLAKNILLDDVGVTQFSESSATDIIQQFLAGDISPILVTQKVFETNDYAIGQLRGWYSLTYIAD